MISADQVKELRDKTGISVMQCRKALEQAEGDMKKAEIILQKQSHSIAEKKSDRELKAGAIASYIHNTGNVGAMVELFCETDFVAKNEEFKKLAYDLAMQVAATNPEFLKAEDISEKRRGEVRETLEKEVSDKPKDMQEKILEGKVDSYFADKVLLEQPFIKDQGIKVKELVESTIQKFGEKVTVGRFVRFSI